MGTAIILIVGVLFIAVFAAILVVRKRRPKLRVGILILFLGVALALSGFSGFIHVIGQPEANLGLSADVAMCGFAVAAAGFVLVIASITKPK